VLDIGETMSDGETPERDPQTYALIGACMAVHSELGCGFLEPVYQDALEIELRIRQIPYQREERLPIVYKGETLKTYYVADFVCFGSILIECKAIAQIGGPQDAQVLNYLKATGLGRALLVNFGLSRLEFKRFVGAT